MVFYKLGKNNAENLETFLLGIIFVITCDSTQSTAADRIKLDINGQQITSFSK